jgi:hypothetical protein
LQSCCTCVASGLSCPGRNVVSVPPESSGRTLRPSAPSAPGNASVTSSHEGAACLKGHTRHSHGRAQGDVSACQIPETTSTRTVCCHPQRTGPPGQPSGRAKRVRRSKSEMGHSAHVSKIRKSMASGEAPSRSSPIEVAAHCTPTRWRPFDWSNALFWLSIIFAWQTQLSMIGTSSKQTCDTRVSNWQVAARTEHSHRQIRSTQDIGDLAILVDGPVQVRPPTGDLEVGLIGEP